jgi:hypothetical protein
MAKIQLFIEYAKENGRKLRNILNFLPFHLPVSFSFCIFAPLNIIYTINLINDTAYGQYKDDIGRLVLDDGCGDAGSGE